MVYANAVQGADEIVLSNSCACKQRCIDIDGVVNRSCVSWAYEKASGECTSYKSSTLDSPDVSFEVPGTHRSEQFPPPTTTTPATAL